MAKKTTQTNWQRQQGAHGVDTLGLIDKQDTGEDRKRKWKATHDTWGQNFKIKQEIKESQTETWHILICDLEEKAGKLFSLFKVFMLS